MCHRHTPSSKRNLSSKIFAKSAATYFLPLTYVEILEEHLGSAVLGVVRALDVDGGGDGGGDRRVRRGERSRLAAGAGDTVALRLGSLDEQLDVGHIRRDAGQREGHRSAGERDGGVGRSLDACECRHHYIFILQSEQSPMSTRETLRASAALIVKNLYRRV